MSLITKPLFSVFSNIISILAALYLVKGVTFSGDLKGLFIAAAIFTAINYFLKPLLKLLLGPVIIITLGIGTIFVNALTLYLLDIFTAHLTINGYLSLFLATLIIAIFNWLVEFSAESAHE
ncbi:MAG: phage holin family protein [Candidatus Magasanikbacteria bacterium]